MTTTTSKVRFIHYGHDGINRVGMNPISGRIDDLTPRQRELWATNNILANPFTASYGPTVTVNEPGPCALADSYGVHADVPAHEDIFATIEFARIDLAPIEAHEPYDIDLHADGDEYTEHCHECGEIDGFHTRDCTIGGA